MKKSILLFALFFTATVLRAQEVTSQERNEWLASFSAVQVSAALDLKLVRIPTSEAPRIVYDTKGSYTTKFRAEVKDRVLHITERIDNRRPERTLVTLYYNELSDLTLSNASASFADTLRQPLLDLTLDGTANLTAVLDVKDLQLQQAGSSTLTLSGAVRYWSFYLSGGKIEAAQLEAMAVRANVTGSGRAALWVTDRLEAKTSTSGKITYLGNPQILRVASKFMGGEIKRAE